MDDPIPKTDLDLFKIVLTEVHGIVQNIRAHTEEISMENQYADNRNSEMERYTNDHILEMENKLVILTERIELLTEKLPTKEIARLTALCLTMEKLGKIPENYNEDSDNQVRVKAKSSR